MLAFRIADRRHPIYDPTGAMLHGGRWNSVGRRVIYAAETYAGALLEVLVHANLGRIPATQEFIEISIPEGVGLQALSPADLPGWDAADMLASRAYGDQWLDERRTAVLLVPSVVTAGRERNVLINPDHPEAKRLTVSDPKPVIWDPRLFSAR